MSCRTSLRRHDRVVQVGHLERFNPAVRATIPLLTKPMFFEVHRLSVFTPRSLDVDVVLDLMIHDIDIVLTMAKSPVKEIRAVGLPILSKKVDIANVRIEFESGCVANFTASRVSTERVRKVALLPAAAVCVARFLASGCTGANGRRWNRSECGRGPLQSRKCGRQCVSRDHAVQAQGRATGAFARRIDQLPAGGARAQHSRGFAAAGPRCASGGTANR